MNLSREKRPGILIVGGAGEGCCLVIAESGPRRDQGNPPYLAVTKD